MLVPDDVRMDGHPHAALVCGRKLAIASPAPYIVALVSKVAGARMLEPSLHAMPVPHEWHAAADRS